MKISSTVCVALLTLIICFTACGWKPEVTAVPLSAPWTTMNLPVKENAVVWKSEPGEFRAVHKDGKREIMKSYTDALKAQGWQPSDFKESGDRFIVDMKKDAETVGLEFYDFNNTGVVIRKQ